MTTDRGFTVNLYQVKKMLGYDSIKKAEKNLMDSYELDKNYGRKYRSLSFTEYVNEKRKHIAGVLGMDEYM